MGIRLTKAKDSPFLNYYGGLTLMYGEDGELYLEMEDLIASDRFGPLTSEQIAAFYILCTATKI